MSLFSSQCPATADRQQHIGLTGNNEDLRSVVFPVVFLTPLFTGWFSCYEYDDVRRCSNVTCLVNGRRGQKPLLTVSAVPNVIVAITQRVKQKA